ncbi:MAG: protein kinase [Myxococcales bacterium]|nr:protein kinase [Myxococcales bacterium]
MTLGDGALRGLRAFLDEDGPGPGDVLADRFEVRQRIGEGGMGVVYAGFDRERGVEIAIKIVRSGGDHDEERFAREVGALVAVSHPAVVSCVAHGLHEGARYFVMERLRGCNLAERLRLGRLSVRETLALGRRLADALAEVHRTGIVHRDIKPSNVFLQGDDDRGDVGRACLLDFGIARALAATTLTAPGAIVGTPGYMAPEQIRADGEPSPPSDVFSLGCVLFECLTGRAPFVAETTYALLARVLVEVTPLIREERPDAPLGVEALIEQMLAKEPRERPSAADVAVALTEMLAALPAAEDDPRIELAPGLFEGDVVADKYRVERRIGEGGMGIVVSARHLELGTRVAIKLLRAGGSEEGRFLREARAVSRIESEHVARVLDVGRTAEGAPFIVMEHLRGVDLSERLAEGGLVEVDVAVRYVRQACEAVGEAHALGIVHRDLKPSNLFIVARRDGTELVKVLDFGISKVTEPLDGASIDLTATADSAVMGSIAYMSPEQLESAARADARSDVWSLGVVLFELLTGARPFEGESAVAIAARIAGASPRAMREARPSVPAALDDVVAKCLAKDADARFQTVADLSRALEPFAHAAVDAEAVDAASPDARPATRAGVRRYVVGAAALVAVVGAFAFASRGAGVPTTADDRRGASEAPSATGERVEATAAPAPSSTGGRVEATAAPAPSTGPAAPSVAAPPATATSTAAPRANPTGTSAPRANPTSTASPRATGVVDATSPRRAPPLPSATTSAPRPLDLRDPALLGR